MKRNRTVAAGVPATGLTCTCVNRGRVLLVL
mgnify:CR=1 FL=1|jgi:hypothetical protein